ncbi:MAG TPA: NAD(P)-dependent oxidoreductase [Kofleriaceae bacterium]
MSVLRDLVADRHVIDVLDRSLPIAEQIGQAEVWLPGRTFVTPEILDAAPRLRLVQYFGTGYDRANVPELERRGLRLARVPATNARSVAELNLLLMLALGRRFQDIPAALAQGLQAHPMGRELGGATVVIVGLGACGGELARLCRGLSMRVVAAVRRPDSVTDPAVDAVVSSTGAGFHAALARADFVCLHARLTDETRGMFGAAELAAMKRGAYLVNTARAELVDRAALEQALDAGRIGGCALDVFWTEPVPADDPLVHHPRCIVTNHVAGFTEQSTRSSFELVARNLDALAADRPLLGQVL